jgi:hypothetical protein
LVVRHPEEAAFTMPLVQPTWIMDDWIEADAFNANPAREGGANFIGDIPKPYCLRDAFSARFSYNDWAPVTPVGFCQKLAERTIKGMS